MKISVLSQYEMHSLVLPEKRAGHYWVRGKNDSGKMTDIVSIEAVRAAETGGDPQWVVKSNRRYKILGKDKSVLQSIVLVPNELYVIQDVNGVRKFVLYTEPLSEDRKRYHGYKVIISRYYDINRASQ